MNMFCKQHRFNPDFSPIIQPANLTLSTMARWKCQFLHYPSIQLKTCGIFFEILYWFIDNSFFIYLIYGLSAYKFVLKKLSTYKLKEDYDKIW